MVKEKKKGRVIGLRIILCILIVILMYFVLTSTGIISAISFGLKDSDFTEQVTKISISGICTVEKTLFGDYKSEKCKDKEKEKEEKEKYDILINQEDISITKSPVNGVIRIKYP